MQESIWRGIKNRLLQPLARGMPGASLRLALHRARGVRIGRNVWIGYDVLLETAYPELISIGDNVTISTRVTIIAHFKETSGVTIEPDVHIGPGVILLPNITIGRGSVVSAGAVVNRSVPANTVVQGNPAEPIAHCTVPLSGDAPLRDFMKGLRPLRRNS